MDWSRLIVIFILLLGTGHQIAAKNGITLSVFTVTSKSVTVQWSRYPGASSYKITATPKQAPKTPSFSQFGTNDVMGSVNSLTPNTMYEMEVTAMDNTSNVLSQAKVEETTAPEVPNIAKAYSKHSNSIIVEFSRVTGATGYTLRAETESGDFFLETQVTDSPGVVLNLKPYTEYIISAMSVNAGGRSQPSLPVAAKTVLPAPQLNTSSPNNSTIIVSWNPVDQAVLYTLCISKEGSGTCVKQNTTDTVLIFKDREPGTIYCIKGNAWDPNGIPGDDFSVCQITRPSIPVITQIMLSSVDPQVLFVNFTLVRGANHYQALSSTGQTCTSTDSPCTISPVSCGQTHTISVNAFNEAGPSDPSNPESFITFPCPPEILGVEEPEPANCTLRWGAVDWVDYYIAFVKRDDGAEEFCNTTTMQCNYICSCGFTYFMNVFAYNKAGSSFLGQVLNYTTIPCCPKNVSISLVSPDTLEIAWLPVRGAELYETKAAGTSDLIFCNDTDPLCALSNLQCNTDYSVVVRPCSELRGCNNTCKPHSGETAPCTPEILSIRQVNMSYVNVSWSANNTKAVYTARMAGQTDSRTCQSAGTFCEVSGLPCGTAYEVSVTAKTSAGLSFPSYTMPLETGPCCPESVNVRQVTQAMTNVTWSAATGAKSYIASLNSPRGTAKCHTLETHCLMGCITCGTNYTVSMTAISGTGHKYECTYQGFSSYACCPSHVKLYRMSNHSIRVYWSNSGAVGYTANLHGSVSNYTCTPQLGSSFCDVSNITCGDVYTVVVAPVSRDGTVITLCSKRMFSVSCSGSNVGMVIYRGKGSD
ncbi:fibronectin type III domain-containing protein 7 [Scleropages formosus]|uniref:fibronectin type III domain-containing protein 7 n=1 Tax=Scleropages formosus TaxID=113540 RepID=UPI0010FAB2BC|nr:fibronectin type III domain-containing protein 7 [Scleropages formosus]